MLIALDYDGTYTAAPEFWDIVLEQAAAHDHTVVCCTMRHKHEDRDVVAALSGKVSQIIFTGRKSKKDFLARLGIKPDVWIDDNPLWIYHNSR